MADNRYPPQDIVLRWNVNGTLHSIAVDYKDFCWIAGRLLRPYLNQTGDHVGFFKGFVCGNMSGDRASQFVSNLLAEAALEAHESADEPKTSKAV